jgi:hypothetical protein
MPNTLRFISILFTSVAMAGGLAHLFELPNKIFLSAADYLTVQEIYRGWALLGIAHVGALVSILVLAVMVRHNRKMLGLTLIAVLCVALSLAVYFQFIYPVNQATLNWIILPDNWLQLRRQWEYSHAVSAVLFFIAFNVLVLSLLVQRNDEPSFSVRQNRSHPLSR